MIPAAIPTADELSSSVTLELSNKGGHVGFITSAEQNVNVPVSWINKRIPEFLKSYL